MPFSQSGGSSNDLTYELAAEFVFECKDSISKSQYQIHKEAVNEVFIEIDRKLRRRPLVGMKQPTPPGAMLGWEGALTVKHKGKPAPGYRWKLYRDGQLTQEGRTNEKSEDSLELDLPGIVKPTYKLEIYAPIYEDEETGNKDVEGSIDGHHQQSSPAAPVRGA